MLCLLLSWGQFSGQLFLDHLLVQVRDKEVAFKHLAEWTKDHSSKDEPGATDKGTHVEEGNKVWGETFFFGLRCFCGLESSGTIISLKSSSVFSSFPDKFPGVGDLGLKGERYLPKSFVVNSWVLINLLSSDFLISNIVHLSSNTHGGLIRQEVYLTQLVAILSKANSLLRVLSHLHVYHVFIFITPSIIVSSWLLNCILEALDILHVVGILNHQVWVLSSLFPHVELHGVKNGLFGKNIVE